MLDADRSNGLSSADPERETPPVYVVGWDASPGSRAALELALRLGEVSAARVVAATVYHPIPVSFSPYGAVSAYRHLEDMLRAEAEATLDRLDGAGVQRRAVGAGSTTEGLHELCEAEGAGLIALGSSARHVAASTGERLLHGSACAVAVCPGPEAPARRIERIAVAYDGREPSRRALDAARDLATGLRARIVVIGVVEPPRLPAALSREKRAEVEDAMRADMGKLLEEAAGTLPSTLEARTRIVTGPAAPALGEACADAGIDLLVLGSRAYGSLRGVLAGSVSRELVRHPPCPVMVVPRGAATPSLATATVEAAHP